MPPQMARKDGPHERCKIHRQPHQRPRSQSHEQWQAPLYIHAGSYSPYTNQQGQRDADFIQFVAYEKNAELAQKYLAKGRKILVISHVKTGSYEKDGKRIYTTEFVVDKIEFLSSAQQDNQSAAPAEQPPQSYANQGFQQVDDDELPF